ncbi:MAG: hypothetical protein RSF75_05415 [Acidaminococcaceae bacterium]
MRHRTKIILIIALAIIACITAGMLYQFSGMKKTPEYSLDIIKTAVKQHDLTTFEKHFDLETFYSQAFDDVIAPTLQQPNTNGISDFLAGIMSGVKQNFVSSMVEQTKRYVETGSMDSDNKVPSQVLAKKFTALTDFYASTYKTVDHAKIEGNIAYLDVTVRQNQIDQDFKMQIKMRKLSDDTWSVVQITNIQQFLASLAKAKEAKLAELNLPIAKEIKTKLAIENSKFEHQKDSRYGASYAFLYKPSITFKAEKQIAEFVGQLTVYNKNSEKIFVQKFIIPGPFQKGSTINYNFSWPLNPFIPSEKELINSPDGDLKLKEEILFVRFTDGSELKLLENIPGTK